MALRPWEVLKDKFGSIFSRDLSKEAPNPASLSGAGIGRADSMGSAEYLEGGSTFNHAVEISDLNDFLEIGEHTDRRARYLEYDRMENIPEVSSALDTYCITKDCIINTPSGDFTIEQLLEKYPNGEEFEVYCYNEVTKKPATGIAHHVRWTKKEQVYEIELDSGYIIKSTADHKFLKRNGKWCKAEDLKTNDHLMPCYQEKIAIQNHKIKSIKLSDQEHDVYDLTTDIYHNFSCYGVIIHNSDEVTVPDMDGKIFKIHTPNQGVKEELEWLFEDLLQLETEDLWSWARNVVKNGDLFLELIIDSDDPRLGIQKIAELPPETLYRIETVRGRLLEFQQSYLGPDYQAVISDIKEKSAHADATVGHHPGQTSVTTTGTNTPYASMSGSPKVNNVIRFSPEQIVHIRIGMKRRGFYPYGVSAIYAGRRIAHLLKLMEDAMVIYRLTRAPERRVFYIDIGTLPPNKGEVVLERVRDKIKKKKIYNRRTGQIDERYNAWAADEDFFIPTRPESNTRIETLPGGCIAMDTKIPLLDGRTLNLQQMKEEYQDGKENWIYSCNPETGEIVPGIVSWAGTTHEKAKVMKLTFDNGKEIICTPDHKFPTLHKGKIRADEFVIGDRIIPFNTRRSKISSSKNNTYNQVYDNKEKKWKFVHRIVGNYFKDIDLHEKFTYDTRYKKTNKDTIHHKDYDRYNNNPDNLIWMTNQDHILYHSSIVNSDKIKEKLHEGIIKHFENLSEEERKIKIKTAIKNLKKGNDIVIHKLKNDHEFRESFTKAQKKGFAKSKKENPEKWIKRSERQTEINKEMWSDQDRKKNAFDKQRMRFDKWMMDSFVDVFKKNDMRIDKSLDILNSNDEFMNHFKELNSHVVRDNFNGNTSFHRPRLEKMIKSFGYENTKQFKNEIELYNHKVTNIEYLDNEIEVGTLTIDIDEKYHDYHTFAIDSIGFIFNSHLGEIDDTKYFREKLMVALKLPKNYLFQDDVSVTRTSFATQDMRFARTIFRIQKIIAHGLKQIAVRHLILKGFTEESIRHLQIKFTAPSDWLELSRSELLSNRYNLAASIKSSSIYDDFTILTSILNHTHDEAKEIIDRKEQQILREQEIQAQAQIFAQLTTPGQEADVTPAPANAMGDPQLPGEMPGMEAMPGMTDMPGMPGEEIPQAYPPEETIEQPKIKSEPKPKRFVDFADLEADEEEIDINYDE